MEIEQRLGLYQVFLKLYEYHPSLLNEILQLEKTSNTIFANVTTRCITGIIQDKQVYLVTNLMGGKTQILHQPQGVWTIGRDRLLSISIPDLRLSRRHAVIQYIDGEGFYLVDLESTNGSFVNGEPVHGRLLLKDGDRLRLSSLAFAFFLCNDCQTLAETPPDIVEQLKTPIVAPPLTNIEQKNLNQQNTELKEQQEKTFDLHNISLAKETVFKSSIAQLNSAQQSEILDRFFQRQIQNQ